MSYHALAQVLGIAEPLNVGELISTVRHGLPSEGIDALSAKLGITPRELSKYLHVSHKTLQRHHGKLLDLNISDRLLTIAKVYAECVDVFESEEVSVHWLKTPLAAIGNATPLEYLDTNEGADFVRKLLVRIDYGVFS